MDEQVNYPVNDGGNFVITLPRCSFFKHKHLKPITTSTSAAS